ncbi:MAG: M15 family metallopeptidase [Bacteroidota bacterium]
MLNCTNSVIAQVVVINSTNYDSLLNVNASYQLVALKSDFIREEIKYATADNFTKKIVYDTAAVYLSVDARNAILKVLEQLKPLNVGLVIYDAYRPYRYTVKFWEIIHDDRYVADPKKGSRHNRGCAVDVGLFDLKTGKQLEMPTAYDDFSENAWVNAKNRTKIQIKNVELLQNAMTCNGFQLFETEWWHFDYTGWQKHPIIDVSFQELNK